MNPSDLLDVLSQHDARPDVVLMKLRGKRRGRRLRLVAGGGGLAVTALVAAGAIMWPAGGAAPETTAIGPGPTTAGGAGYGAEGCLALDRSLPRLSQDGGSLITGHGKLTGRTATDGYRYAEMVLTDVRTLGGPPVADGATVWTLVATPPPSPQPGTTLAGPEGPLWGPGNALIGFYSAPQKLGSAEGKLGATITQVPLAGDKAVVVARGCWNGFAAGNLAGTPYTGPLTEIPGSGTLSRLSGRGFIAIPLASIEKLIG
jgi:hypothetical protein